MIAKQTISLACIATLAQAVMLNTKLDGIEQAIDRDEIDAEGATAVINKEHQFNDLAGGDTENTDNQLKYRASYSPYDQSPPDTCYDNYWDYPSTYTYNETKCRPQNDYGYSYGFPGSGQEYYAGWGGQEQPSYYNQSHRHETYPCAGGYGYGHSHAYGAYPHSHSSCDGYGYGDTYGHSHPYGGAPHSHSTGCSGGSSKKSGGCKGKCSSGGNGSFDPFFTLPDYGTLDNKGSMTTSWNQCLTYKPNYWGGYSSGCDCSYQPHYRSSSYSPDYYGGSGYDNYRSPNKYHCDSYSRQHGPSSGGCATPYYGGRNDYSYGGYNGYSGYGGCDGRQQCTEYQCVCKPVDRYSRSQSYDPYGIDRRIYATGEEAELQGGEDQQEFDPSLNDGGDFYDPYDPYFNQNQGYDDGYNSGQSRGPVAPDFAMQDGPSFSDPRDSPRASDQLKQIDDNRFYAEPEYYDPIPVSEVKDEPKKSNANAGIFNWDGWGAL